MDSPMPDLTGNESTGHKRTRSRHSRTSSTLGGSDVLGMVAGTGSIRAVEPMWKGWQVDDQQSGLEMPLFGSVPGGPGAGEELVSLWILSWFVTEWMIGQAVLGSVIDCHRAIIISYWN